jgi:hypothetical protein
MPNPPSSHTGPLAAFEQRICQCTESNEFALGDEDHAGNGEDQDESNAKKRVNRAVCYSIMDQKENNSAVHRPRPIVSPARESGDRKVAAL